MKIALSLVMAALGFLAIDLPASCADSPKTPDGYKRYSQKLDKTNATASILLPEKATEGKVLDKKYEVSNTGNLPGGGFWSLHLYDTGADKDLRIAKTPKERFEQTREDTKEMYLISESKPAKCGKHEGLEYGGIAKANKSFSFTSRAFVVKGTLVIVTISNFGKLKAEEVNKILDSLAIE